MRRLSNSTMLLAQILLKLSEITFRNARIKTVWRGSASIVGQLSTTTPIGDYGFQDVAITSDGTLAVVATGLNGIWVVDVSVPSAPHCSASLQA